MAVSFKVSGHSPSNKPNIPLADTAYICAEGNGNSMGVMLKPKLDKLAVTFAIDCKEDQTSIKELLFAAAKPVEKSGDPGFKSHAVYKGGPYKHHIEMSVPSVGSGISVHFAPKASSKAPFLRFELNPGKLGKAGFEYFRETLLPEFLLDNYSYSDIAKTGKVTRIDIACDVIGIPISQMLFSTKKGGKSHIYYGGTGSIETIYLGLTSKGPSKLKLYNKGQQLSDVEGDTEFGTAAHVRVEVSIMPNRPIADLENVPKNPLLNVDVISLQGSQPPEQPHHWAMFGDSCRQRGRQGALALLPLDVRPAYTVALAAGAGKIWKPDRLWKLWKTTIVSCGLLDGIEA